MGAKQSSAQNKKKVLKELLATTNFSKAELKKIHSEFRKDFPEGALSYEQFHRVFSAFFPVQVQRQASTNVYEHHLFRSFDANDDGRLDFSEFVQALSTLQRGTAHDKLNWIFRMYDIDGDGQIMKDELVEIINSARMVKTTLEALPRNSLRPTNGKLLHSATDEEKSQSLRRAGAWAEAQACDLFDRLDLSRTGKLSKAQFLKSAEESSEIQSKVLSLLLREEDTLEVYEV